MMTQTPEHERNAQLVISLKADSGYSSTETHRISADQWRRILEVANETAPTGAA